MNMYEIMLLNFLDWDNQPCVLIFCLNILDLCYAVWLLSQK